MSERIRQILGPYREGKYEGHRIVVVLRDGRRLTRTYTTKALAEQAAEDYRATDRDPWVRRWLAQTDARARAASEALNSELPVAPKYHPPARRWLTLEERDARAKVRDAARVCREAAAFEAARAGIRARAAARSVTKMPG